jgi:beta-lactamase superfamily II metal-dependent hydrolase
MLLAGCSASQAPAVTGEFTVEVLKVGKADAVVLKTENGAVVIDCGEKGDGKEVLHALEKMGAEKIDYLFITHFDKDHVGGAAKVINGIEVDKIVTPDYEGDSDEYFGFCNAAEKNKAEVLALSEKMTFTLDDVLFNVYPPQKSNYDESDNDFSLVISALHGENSFLFAGDAEEERLKELKSQLKLNHTFLKVPHHGRYNDFSESFIKSVSPKIAVITCSDKNPADEKLLDALKSASADVYLSTDGDLKAVSDGSSIKIKQGEREINYD